MTTDEIITRLKEGNKRFVKGDLRHPHTDTSWRDSLQSAQHPFCRGAKLCRLESCARISL